MLKKKLLFSPRLRRFRSLHSAASSADATTGRRKARSLASMALIRWGRAAPLSTSLSSRGDALLLLLLALLSVLTGELSRCAALASSSHFEGFDPDAEDVDHDLYLAGESLVAAGPAPSATSLSPESHQVPPPAPPPPPPPPAPSDLWDEDEFEGIPPADHHQDQHAIPTAASHLIHRTHVSSTGGPPSPSPFSPWSYSLEIACVVFLICLALNYIIGKRRNEAIALACASRLAAKEFVFDKNFCFLGTGDGNVTPLLLREGPDVFKFYASGRRYCQGLMATMELLSRHDLLSWVFQLVFRKKDAITFEVVMNEDSMEYVVLALARKKTAKAMHKEERDLQRFASPVVAPPAGRKWVSDELTVLSELKEVAGDLITDLVLDQVFGDEAFKKFGKWFVSLHFSDQHPGSRKKNLNFKFVLPDNSNMSDMTRLLSLVPHYVDLIGRYKLRSHAYARAEATRVKASQEAHKELQNARQEALQKKKAERKKLMEEVEAKLTVEALRKKEEKEHTRQLKKSGPKVKMLRR